MDIQWVMLGGWYTWDLSQTIVNWLNQLGVEMGLSKLGIGENL